MSLTGNIYGKKTLEGNGYPRGNDGISPIVEVTENDTGHRVAITDVYGTKAFDVRHGKDGEPGYTPQKGIDYFDGKDGYTPVKGVDYNDGYTPRKNVDYFDGEKGDAGYTPVKGKDYFDGKDGVSATHSWNGTTLTVKSASGTSSADLKGEKGDKGDKGDGFKFYRTTHTCDAPVGEYVFIPLDAITPNGANVLKGEMIMAEDGKLYVSVQSGDNGYGYNPCKVFADLKGPRGLPGAVQTVNGAAPDKKGNVQIETGGMGGADWNAAQGQPGHVANRTHWVDREEVPLNFTFDGDITGKETVNMDGFVIIKISNAIIPMDDLIGATATMSDGMVIEVTAENSGDILGDGSIIGSDVFFAVQRNCTVNGISFTAGLYFVYIEEDSFTMYTQSLVKEGATVMSETVHKLDAKFLPDNIGGNGGVVMVNGDLATMTADTGSEQIRSAMMQGKTVFLNLGNGSFTLFTLSCVGFDATDAFFVSLNTGSTGSEVVDAKYFAVKPDGSIIFG